MTPSTSTETARPGKVLRTFSSLKVRNFRYYFAGQSVSLMGTWMQGVAQSWLVFTRTHSGFDVGLVVALQTLPILLFGPLGGTVADRFRKYDIIRLTQTLAGLQALTLGLLEVTGHLPTWAIYAVATSLGFVTMVDNPTRQTFIVEMVGRDELANAVTLNSVMVNAARAVGLAVAGELIATVGTGWCFLINAVSYLFVLGALKAIHTDELSPAERTSRMKGQLTEGFRYVAHTPVLRDALLMMALVGMLAYEFQVSLPLMAGSTFHGNSATYGYLTASMGVGAVVGGLIAASNRSHQPRRLATTALLFGGTILLAAVAPTTLTEMLALLLVGALSVTFLSLGNAILQLQADPSMRGRVMGLWSVAFLGSTPIGGPIVGVVGGTLGARYGLGLGGVATLVAGGLGHLTLLRKRASEPPGARAVITETPISQETPVVVIPVGVSESSVARRADPGAARADRSQRLTAPPRTP
ncbi:MAG: MFS transporter [Actinomycetota bacterium]|nr:MFS transporter [Actinomycetota bacterium]